MALQKQIQIKTYDGDGNFKNVFYEFGISQIKESLNGGLGQLTVTIPRRFDEYNSDGDLDLGNELIVEVSDKEATSGIRIYSGEIDEVNTTMGPNEEVVVVCSGYVSQLANTLNVRETTTTIIRQTTSSYKPGEQIKIYLDWYQAFNSKYRVTYGTDSIDITGGTSSKFNYVINTTLEGIQNALERSPEDYYWRIDADNVFNYGEIPSSPTHYFVVGKDVAFIDVKQSLRDVKNQLLFTNGLTSTDSDAIMDLYENSTSVSNYGPRVERKRDGRFKATSSASDDYGERFVNINKDPSDTVTARILDSNLWNGYDLESIHAGDTCKFLNVEENSALTDNMLITQVARSLTGYVDITIEDKITYVSRELLNNQQRNNMVSYTDDQIDSYTSIPV